MATTVTAADLTVTITESYSLNGVDYGNTTNKTFASNGEVIQRIMTIAAQSRGSAWTNIINFGAADAAGVADITQIGANANTDAIDIEFVCVTA